MKEPTQEELKRFWEWCGFEDLNEDLTYGRHPSWNIGTGRSRMPELTLDNLFKYAVPKTKDWSYLVDWAIQMAHAYADGRSRIKPEVYLFYAINKIIEG